LPVELQVNPDEVVYWPCENGLIVAASSGIILILIRLSEKSFPVACFEYTDRPENEVFLFETDIIEKLPEIERKPGVEIRLEAISAGGGRVDIDWQKIMEEGKSHLSEENTDMFESRMVGNGDTEGSQDLGYFIFNSPFMTSGLTNLRIFSSWGTRLMVGISHARALYAIEFHYADGTTLVFGAPHPRSRGTDIPIDTDGGELIRGFSVRAGEWIDAIKVITNKKESTWLGHIGNTRTFQLTPPQGYEIIGIYGRMGRCCDGFGVLYRSSS
jgi:Jacalin-like lectin domain